MPITEHFDEQEMFFECRIHLTELHSEQDLALALEAYSEAIDLIRNRINDDRIWNFGIKISIKRGLVKVLNRGTSLRILRKIIKEQGNGYGRSSWGALCPEFWLVTYQFASLRPQVFSILDKIEKLLKHARSVGRSTASLWEDEHTQFGEPLASLLALHDLRFVDNYRLMMNQWDMDHEFQQFEVINAIIHIHGMCEETEQLLYDRSLACAGQNGENQLEELYPLLQDAYGEFTQSRLFERIITEMHSLDMRDRYEALEDYRRLVRENPHAKPRPRNTPPFHYSDNADLKSSAKRIFASLDASHPLSDFL